MIGPDHPTGAASEEQAAWEEEMHRQLNAEADAEIEREDEMRKQLEAEVEAEAAREREMQEQAFLELQPGEQATIVRIEFDGGTPCNVPRLGYGIGYGSYQIDGDPIVRCDHGRPMSCNVAEIATLIVAMKSVLESRGDVSGIILEVHGDSKNALGRLSKPISKKMLREPAGREAFISACQQLHALALQFAQVKPMWRGRARSVEVFGH